MGEDRAAYSDESARPEAAEQADFVREHPCAQDGMSPAGLPAGVMVHTQQYTTASIAGVCAGFGGRSLRRWQDRRRHPSKWRWTARISKHTAALVAGGASEQAIGVTWGGRNTKVHALVDNFCRPWVIILMSGNVADCTGGAGVPEPDGWQHQESCSVRSMTAIHSAYHSGRMGSPRKLTGAATSSNAIIAGGFQAHCHALRQTHEKFLFQRVLVCSGLQGVI
jgi:hypothetical protein